MAYKNPVPIAFDVPMSTEVYLSFKFEGYVSQEDAAESISKLIAEKHNGKIPSNWIKLIKPALFAAD